MKSVFVQDLGDDLEVILVDDGSTDGSGALCDRYAASDPRVSVIHKPNGGLSSARNAGVAAATGDYLMFADSDDWWNEEVNVRALFDRVRSEPGVEMFLLGSLDYLEGDGFYSRDDCAALATVPTDSACSYYRALSSSGNIQPHAATKILKRSFVLENGLTFKEGIVSEDYEWMFRLLRCLGSVRIINEPLYVYRVGRQGSITNTVSIKSVVDLLGIVEASLKYYEDRPSDPLRELELASCSYLWFIALGLSSQLSFGDARAVLNMLRSVSFVCSYSRSRKTRLAHAAYRVLGPRGAAFALGTYIRLNKRKAINRTKVRPA